MTSFITPESLINAQTIKKGSIIAKKEIVCKEIKEKRQQQQQSAIFPSPLKTELEEEDNNYDAGMSQFFGAQIPIEQLHQEIIGFKPFSSNDEKSVRRNHDHHGSHSGFIQYDSRVTFKRTKLSSPVMNIEDEIDKKIKCTLDDKIDFGCPSSFDTSLPSIQISDQSIQIRKKKRSDDFYTPRWIRGYGNVREGLCELCNPGQWFRTKQSSYWYHMNFYHGISASTGKPYDSPDDWRESSKVAPFVYSHGSSSSDHYIVEIEGHCKNCQQWIPLGKRMTRGTDFILESTIDKRKLSNMNQWYRHCQKCQSKRFLSGC